MTDTGTTLAGGGYDPFGGSSAAAGAGGGPLSDAGDTFSGLGDQQGSRLRVRDQYSTTSGALPSWLQGEMSLGQLQSSLSQMTWSERLELKRRLYFAGYYGPEAMYNGQIPTQGDLDAATGEAWDAFLGEASGQIGTGRVSTIEQALSSKMDEMAQTNRDAAVDAYKIPDVVEGLQTLAGKELGRELSPQEIQSVLDAASKPYDPGPPTQEQIATADAGVTGMYYDETGNRGLAPTVLTGGGPDSSAIQFARNLAQSFGLTVTKDYDPTGTAPFEEFSQGRGVQISGDPERMMKLHEWAKERQGQGQTFGEVMARYDGAGDEPTSIALTINDGVERPNISAAKITDDTPERFLEAIRRPGGFHAYQWEGEGADRRGAFGISDDTWQRFAQQVGIQTDDHSPAAQNKVARAYAAELYAKYGDWEDVAMAFRKNETEADKRSAYKKFQQGTTADFDTSEDDWVRQAIADMGNTRQQDITGIFGSGGDAYTSMYGEDGNLIPRVDYLAALRGNDPRFYQQRVQRAYSTLFMGERLAGQFGPVLADLEDGKLKQSTINKYGG